MKQLWYPIIRLCAASLCVVLFAPASAAAAPTHWAQDAKQFASPVVQIYLDWKSFTDRGMASQMLDPFSRSVQAAAKRWNEVGRSNVRFYWGGRSDGRVPGPQEVVFRMRDCLDDDDGGAVANAASAGPSKGRYVTFFRTMDDDDNLITCQNPKALVWDFGYPAGGSRSIYGVALHELGHTLGLITHTPLSATRYSAMTVNGVSGWAQRLGPFPDDIGRLQALYGVPTAAERLTVRRFDTANTAWNVQSTLSYQDFGNTTLPVGAVRVGNRIPFAYTLPTWNLLMTGFGDLSTNTWTMLGGSFADSAYGVTMEAGEGEIMLAYVEWAGDPVETSSEPNCQIRLMRSTNQGLAWQRVTTFPPSHTAATPELAYLGSNVWVMFYPYFGNTKQTVPPTFIPDLFGGPGRWSGPNYTHQFGRLVARVSSDDGATWSEEVTPAPDGSWPFLKGTGDTFAADPGFRVASEVKVHRFGTSGIGVSFSAARTSPTLGTTHFGLESIVLSTTSVPAAWNLYTPYPMGWADGRDIAVQGMNANGLFFTRFVSQSGGQFSNWIYGTFSRMPPTLTDDPTSNLFFMFATEPSN